VDLVAEGRREGVASHDHLFPLFCSRWSSHGTEEELAKKRKKRSVRGGLQRRTTGQAGVPELYPPAVADPGEMKAATRRRGGVPSLGLLLLLLAAAAGLPAGLCATHPQDG
jgi:hypothetical protein